jgi:hypothetical protein
MLKPSRIVDAVVTALKTIPDLVTILVNDDTRIVGYHFVPGLNQSLNEALNTMLQPSLLVAYKGVIGGNFNGYVIFKHEIEIYYRGANQRGFGQPVKSEDIWYVIVNAPINSGTLNIRQVQIMPGQLEIMETPSMTHMQDMELQDYFVGNCIFPEIDDQPYSD